MGELLVGFGITVVSFCLGIFSGATLMVLGASRDSRPQDDDDRL